MKYQKINSLFKRDENNLIIPTEFCQDEFGYLKDLKWECTEKIDGTNMRVIITPIYNQTYIENANAFVDSFAGFKIEIKGKSDEAIVPKHLMAKMQEIFTKGKIYDAFAEHYILNDGNFEKNLNPIILYGEGYGVKIQKGGNYISNGVDFILFDIKIGDMWLQRYSCEEIAKSLNIKIVPFVGLMTIPEAIEYVKKGFISNISENRNYLAEGLVLKTPLGLMDRRGNRLIAKIKYKDFQDLERKSPKKYHIYKRTSNTSDSRYDYDTYLDCFIDKKIALAKLKEYKEADKTEMYFIKEMNANTDEIYHEIYE